MNGSSEQAKPATDARPARFVINAEFDGFPVAVEVEGKADALKTMIERLKAIGAQPPQVKTGAETSSAKTGVPVCPIHSAPMKPSRNRSNTCEGFALRCRSFQSRPITPAL